MLTFNALHGADMSETVPMIPDTISMINISMSPDELLRIEQLLDLTGFDAEKPYASIQLSNNNFLFCNLKSSAPEDYDEVELERACRPLGLFTHCGKRAHGTSITRVLTARRQVWKPIFSGLFYYYRSCWIETCGMRYNIPAPSSV